MWYGPSRLLWNAMLLPSALHAGRTFVAVLLVSWRIGDAERVHAAHGQTASDPFAVPSILTHSRASRIANAAINTPPRRSESCARIPSFAAVLAVNAPVTKKKATARFARVQRIPKTATKRLMTR